MGSSNRYQLAFEPGGHEAYVYDRLYDKQPGSAVTQQGPARLAKVLAEYFNAFNSAPDAHTLRYRVEAARGADATLYAVIDTTGAQVPSSPMRSEYFARLMCTHQNQLLHREACDVTPIAIQHFLQRFAYFPGLHDDCTLRDPGAPYERFRVATVQGASSAIALVFDTWCGKFNREPYVGSATSVFQAHAVVEVLNAYHEKGRLSPGEYAGSRKEDVYPGKRY